MLPAGIASPEGLLADGVPEGVGVGAGVGEGVEGMLEVEIPPDRLPAEKWSTAQPLPLSQDRTPAMPAASGEVSVKVRFQAEGSVVPSAHTLTMMVTEPPEVVIRARCQ